MKKEYLREMALVYDVLPKEFGQLMNLVGSLYHVKKKVLKEEWPTYTERYLRKIGREVLHRVWEDEEFNELKDFRDYKIYQYLSIFTETDINEYFSEK